jgi:transglutaminase-like putative cysteine protease
VTDRSRLVGAGVVAGLGLAALAPFGVLFTDVGWLVHAAAAVGVVSAVSLVLSPRRPAGVVATAAVVALVGFETVVVRGRVPTADAVGATWVALARSWDALLAAPRPAVPGPDTAAFPAVVAAVVVFAASEIAARERWLVPAVAAAVAEFGVGLLFAGPGGASPAGSLVLVAGALVVVLADPGRAGSEPAGARRGRWLAAVPAVAGALVVTATAAGLVAPVREPPDLRDRRRPPPDTAGEPTPLAEVARDLADPDDPVVFRVALHGSAGDRRVRVATLDDYDGQRWGITGAFRAVAAAPTGRLDDAGAGSSPTVEQDYEITAARAGSFLPALGRPAAVTVPGDEVLHDPVTGTLRLRHPVPVGQRYRLRSRLSPPPVPSPAERAALGRLPSAVPDPLVRYLAELGSFPGARETLDAVAADLRGDRVGYDPGAPPGHSYARLVAFLGFDSRVGSDARVGTSEQPAAVLAVLARLIGVPARVVVGYELPPDDGTAGALAVTAHRIRAWAEVYLPEAGWVAYDPTSSQVRRPTTTVPPTRPTPPTTTVTLNQSPGGAVRAGVGPPSSTPCAPATLDCRATRPGGPRRWLAAGLLALAALPGAVIGAKAGRRRRRRRRGGPAARVLGAWRETVERIRSHGVAVAPSLTAADLARRCESAAGERLGRAMGDWVVVLDATIYAASDPPEHLAQQAWDLDGAVAAVLRARSSWPRRARVALDPRPLWPDRRRPDGRRPEPRAPVRSGT